MQGAGKRAVVLLSGGVDSSTVLAMACRQGFAAYALTYDYGQRQRYELTAARRVAQALGVVQHRFMTIDLSSYGGSALTSDLPVPRDRSMAGMAASVPVTYVPARNTVFLAAALAWAEVLQAFYLFIGVNAVDYSGYPDCRPEFIRAFQRLANLATVAATSGRGRFRIRAPLLRLSKAEILRRAHALGLDLSLTHSCYDPRGELACGRCDACVLRRAGFTEAGLPDPTRYIPTSSRETPP